MKSTQRLNTLCHSLFSRSLLFMILTLPLGAIAQSNTIYQWARDIGVGMGYDIGFGIAIDAGGNTYVTGRYSGIVDFDPGPAVAELTSAGGYDIFIAKYDANGNYVFAKNMGGPYHDESKAIALDINGNVYITGSYIGLADFDPGEGTAFLDNVSSSDIFLAKYDASGNYIYAISMGGQGSEEGTSIAVDDSGNAYITGNFGSTADFDPGPETANLTAGAGSMTNIFFAKYNSNGQYVYAKALTGVTDSRSRAIAIDAIGNVHITGYFQYIVDFDPGPATANLTSMDGFTDIFFAKYDVSGNYLYAKRIGGEYHDYGNAIAVDNSGNVYITGSFSMYDVDFNPAGATAYLSAVGNDDIFLAKYNANGNYLFAKRMGGTGSDSGHGIVLEANGHVFLTGSYMSTSDFDPGPGTANINNIGTNNSSAFLAKYDESGNYLYAKRMGGTENTYGRGIAADENGNAYVTGYFEGTADFNPGNGTANLHSQDGSDVFFAKYSEPIIPWYLDFDADGWFIDIQQNRRSPGAGWTSVLPSGGNGDCDDNDATAWTVEPAEITITLAADEVDINIPPFVPGVANPTNGVWSGSGIINGMFSPQQAGVGIHTISYTVDGDGLCVSTASASENILVTGTISILENAAEQISVFPTSTSNVLNIQGQDIINATLTDMNGRLINNITINDNNAVLNMERYASGFYLLSVTTSASTQVFKIVKE